ncbi:mammalian cell entry protein [Mycobacterium sp. NPDC051198]
MAVDADTADPVTEEADEVEPQEESRRRDGVRLAIAVGAAMVVALSVLVGWLGWRYQHEHREQLRDQEFLQAARQGAVNLTTIDFADADADVKRILDVATGQFYDDFARRSQPFVDVVKQAKSKSEGTVTAAGLSSVEDDEAQALVTVSVRTSNAGAPEQQPRLWRMRIDVQRVDGAVKVSNVQFVP